MIDRKSLTIQGLFNSSNDKRRDIGYEWIDDFNELVGGKILGIEIIDLPQKETTLTLYHINGGCRHKDLGLVAQKYLLSLGLKREDILTEVHDGNYRYDVCDSKYKIIIECGDTSIKKTIDIASCCELILIPFQESPIQGVRIKCIDEKGYANYVDKQMQLLVEKCGRYYK